MRINYRDINRQLSIDKEELREAIVTRETVKNDTDENRLIISPVVPVRIAKNLSLQYNKLNKCIRILSQDTILPEWNFEPLREYSDEEVEYVERFWRENKYELYKAVQEYFTYGFGCLEVGKDKNTGEVVRLFQFPAETAHIREVPDNRTGGRKYYAVQEKSHKRTIMRLSRFDYSEEDYDKPECLWIGEGKTEDFYEVPYWIPAFNNISSKIALEELDAERINKGNLMSGVLVVTGPPAPPSFSIDGEEPIPTNDQLREQMDDVGTGILTLALETSSPDIPLKVEYIKITEDNYDYLSRLGEKADQETLSCFSIPKIRLMIDDVKESMNSNKSDTIWEIYTFSLEVEQMPFEKVVRDFNKKYFDFDALVDFGTPIFSDKKSLEVTNVRTLFNSGILTLGQAINIIQKYYPEFELELEEDSLLYGERFYRGNPLGMAAHSTDYDYDEHVDEVNHFLERIDHDAEYTQEY